MEACEALAESREAMEDNALAVPLTGADPQGWRALLATPLHKGYRSGTHRTRAPRETLQRLRPHLPAMGITRVANITGLDLIGVPVVMACRPNSRSLATSLGKGLDVDAAMVSSMMECVELHHAERVMLPLLLASTAEMKARGPLIDVARLPRIRNSRYHEHFPLLWVQGCDLVSGHGVWLPFETVHASASSQAPSGSGCFAATSNGLASGNHRLEAVVHALLEVIERDSTAVWGAGGPGRPEQSAIDLDSVDDPGCRWVLDRCRSAGVYVTAYETTSDVGVPSFLCELRDAGTDPSLAAVFSGLGCHVDRGVALLRALTEAVQSRLTLIAGSRDDLSRRDYVEKGHPPPARASRRFPGGVSMASGETFNEDFEQIRARLLEVGVDQIVAVDLTRLEFQIPVVRVVVPGLEGPDDDPEYMPGPRARAAAGRPS